jgi:radical SAM-linked protein
MKLCAIFSKTGDGRFISHLDLVRLFQRASRRADMPVTVSKGFNPHLKISISKALKLGIESVNEEAVFQLDKAVNPEDFVAAMNAKLPDNIKFLEAKVKV